MTNNFRFVGTHPEDLASGRVLEPGEAVKLTKDEAADPHNAHLIEDGKLISTASAKGDKEAES